MADNPKRDEKRDAKIEEKRRKLAEQRIRRAQETVTYEPEDFDYSSEKLREKSENRPQKESKKGSGSGKGSGKIRFSTKLGVVAAVLVFLLVVYGIFQIKDYFNKRTDYRVTDEGFTHAARFENAVPLYGIDVSEHQPAEINWEKIKTSGVDYVFARAGYRGTDKGGLHIDENFEKYVKEADKAGLMVGAYFYSQALTPEEAIEEADFLLEQVKSYNITLPLVIDYEIYKGGRLDKKIDAGEMYAASIYHDVVLAFCRHVEEAGYESAVYANKDMLTNYMQADLLDDSATIWLARYDEKAGLKADYWFWQCSDSGQAGDMDELIDRDFWYMEPDKVYPTRGKTKRISDEQRISIGDCQIHFKEYSSELHHFRAVPKFSMTYDGRGMRKGRDYVASAVKNTEVGTGYVIIRGIGKYKDWIMYPFKIDRN